MKFVPRIFTATLLFGILFDASSAYGQKKQRVSFQRGGTSVSVQGSVRGFSVMDYVVRATAGQRLVADLTGTPVSPVLTIFTPSGDNLEGATQINDVDTVLPKSGDYVLRVGMMRAAARRKRSQSNFKLKLSIQ